MKQHPVCVHTLQTLATNEAGVSGKHHGNVTLADLAPVSYLPAALVGTRLLWVVSRARQACDTSPRSQQAKVDRPAQQQTASKTCGFSRTVQKLCMLCICEVKPCPAVVSMQHRCAVFFSPPIVLITCAWPFLFFAAVGVAPFYLWHD